MKLVNDNAFYTVDDERSTVGHQRDVADKDGLLFNVLDTGFLFGVFITVPKYQACFHTQ